ncbi:MAG: site-2 protease family protein [Actinomycetota bacterium]
MFGSSWRIFSLRGVPVRVDGSWVFIALLITFSFWNQFENVYAIDSSFALGLAVLGAGLFFGSILLHEMAHAEMARANNIPVESITLFLFGGMTSANVESKGPKTEFLVAVVGPGTSLAVGGLCWLIAQGGGFLGRPLAGTFGYIGWLNLTLAVFNLIPGYPLDGGRLLRSIVWGATGNRALATRVASWGGMIVGAVLIALGVLEFTRDDNLLSGIWLAYIGFFLFQAARSSERGDAVRAVLADGVAADAMSPPPMAIPADVTLSEALDRYLRGNETLMFPVVENNRLVGVVNWDSASRVGQHDPLKPVRDAVLPLDGVKTVTADAPLLNVIQHLTGGGAALVLRDGELVGSIGPDEIARWASARAR